MALDRRGPTSRRDRSAVTTLPSPQGWAIVLGVLSEDRLHSLAARLVSVAGVVGVTLGGSRAQGRHKPESDVDLSLYYRGVLDVEALSALAAAVDGSGAGATPHGAWGPWVDGGAWLRIDDTAVDWIYGDLERVHDCWRAAQQGRFGFHAQVGHPLGVLDVAYAGELAVSKVLSDPTGELSALQRAAASYPPALGNALVGLLREARFSRGTADKAVSRGDTTCVAGCLFRAVELCAHALHGRARRWLVNEKGAVAAAGDLPGAPADFSRRAHGVLAHLGTRPHELASALAAARALVAEVEEACAARAG